MCVWVRGKKQHRNGEVGPARREGDEETDKASKAHWGGGDFGTVAQGSPGDSASVPVGGGELESVPLHLASLATQGRPGRESMKWVLTAHQQTHRCRVLGMTACKADAPDMAEGSQGTDSVCDPPKCQRHSNVKNMWLTIDEIWYRGPNFLVPCSSCCILNREVKMKCFNK